MSPHHAPPHLTPAHTHHTTPYHPTRSHPISPQPTPHTPPQKSLKRLVVSHNRFTQGLPETLTTLTKLRQIVADSNRLAGAFPSDMVGMMPDLTHLSVQRNRFTSELQGSISGATSLMDLNISANDLEGRLVPVAREYPWVGENRRQR